MLQLFRTKGHKPRRCRLPFADEHGAAARVRKCSSTNKRIAEDRLLVLRLVSIEAICVERVMPRRIAISFRLV